MFLLIAASFVPLHAQSVAGEPGAGIPESGSLSLANALAGVGLDPSTGVLTSTLHIDSPAARGRSQPGVDLAYNSAAGIREAGVGWGLNLPKIERQNRDGPPLYQDPADFNANSIAAMDRFVFGGKPLIPVCVISVVRPTPDGPVIPIPVTSCNTVLPAGPGFPDAEALPLPPLDGWMYFRLETDDSHARFFWSPDRKTWWVQFPGGEIAEFGVPLVEPSIFPGPTDSALDYDHIRHDDAPLERKAFRWNLVRRLDLLVHDGGVANVVAYRWTRMGIRELGYLTDICDTPPSDRSQTLTPDTFAHHIRLTWITTPFIRGLAMAGFRATPDLLLNGIDVTGRASQSAAGTSSRHRQLIRRYHLDYLLEGNRFYLKKFSTEGRCAPVDELPDGSLPPTNCRQLPATTLRYSPRERADRAGGIALPFPPKHEPGRPIPVTVLDVNGDSLPDFVSTKETKDPTVSQQLYLNGTGGYFAVPVPILGNTNIFSPIGRTVTGAVNVVNNGPAAAVWVAPMAQLPPPATFVPDDPFGGARIFVAAQNSTGLWHWTQPAQIIKEFYSFDFRTPDNPVPFSVVGDVDGDGLPDEVFFRDNSFTVPREAPADWKQRGATDTISLGAFRKSRTLPLQIILGDGESVEPSVRVASCFGPSPNMVSSMEWGEGKNDTPSFLIDMNGDGLGDLAFITKTQKSDGRVFIGVNYWPGDGRGNFTACTDESCACTQPGRETPHVAITPFEITPVMAAQLSSKLLALADVNGDGFADLIIVTGDGLNIYWNADGRFWGSLTQPNLSLAANSISPNWNANYPPRLQFADMNGNGLTDVVMVVGDEIAFFDIQNFSALSGFGPAKPAAWAPRPGLLIGIDNGLGGSTEIKYISTTDLARSEGGVFPAPPPKEGWPNPQAMQVVKEVAYKSGLPGDVQTVVYAYRNPVYDGVERRFRGFRNVSTTRPVGTGTVRTDDTYYIGVSGSVWTEPLLISSELSDGRNLWHSTKVLSWRIQDVINGAFPGGVARSAYVEAADTILFDAATWSPTVDTTPVTVKDAAGKVVFTSPVPVRSRSHARIRMEQVVDTAGNTISHINRGHINDDGTAIDEPVIRTVVMNPPDLKWMSLPASVVVTPFSGTGQLPRQRRFEYNDLGQLKNVFATLSGTAPLLRFHEDRSKQVAPFPAAASRDGEVLISSTDYDDFGNITRVQGSNQHCVTTEYDNEYAAYPVFNTVFSGGCGSGGLRTRTTWDQGFMTPVAVTTPDDIITIAQLDDFGRLVATFTPDPQTGVLSPVPSTKIEYAMQDGDPVQRVKSQWFEAAGQAHTTYNYFDSLGRSLLSVNDADPGAGDGGRWVVSGMVNRVGGLVFDAFEPSFYNGDPERHPLALSTSAATHYDYEPFGRLRAVNALDGTRIHERTYQALGVEDTDAAGRVRATTLNGLGRVVLSEDRTTADRLRTSFTYEVDGSPSTVTLTHAADTSVVGRAFQYDSLGRKSLMVEPNTSVPNGALSKRVSWRYVWDDSGQLVGTSDARGCGMNLFHDGMGRVIAEDFSPCLSSQADYSAPDLSTGIGAEVVRTFDGPEPGQTTDFGVNVSYLKGRLAATRDRGAHTLFGYDGWGRTVSVARQIAAPPGAAVPAGASPYEDRWSRATTAYDEGNRMTRQTTGADVPELLGAGGESATGVTYTMRGFVSTIGGSYGPLLSGEVHSADGLTMLQEYADPARTTATFGYDARRRLMSSEYSRVSPGPWVKAPGYLATMPGPETLQTVLLNASFAYDVAGNPKTIGDARIASEWPKGAAPVTRSLHFDPLDRLQSVDYGYAGGSDIQVDPFAVERANGASPVAAGKTPSRILSQTFGYDWLGNLTQSDDDAKLFYDRSLGAIAVGSQNIGPNQIRGAGPALQVLHDVSGNLTDIAVQRPGPCTGEKGCGLRFHYDWDEVGQLARARRWDFAAAPDIPALPSLPSGTPAADLVYLYDDGGARVLKASTGVDGAQRYTAEIFASLRLENATWDTDSRNYTRTPATEAVYLGGLARVVHAPALPSADSRPQHVFLFLSDHLGSTTAVVDRDTSELVERTTQQAYGSPDSDYRPARWAGFREPYQFTGKEDDYQVGLTYFGARYYSPALGRFVSPDPLAIHALEGDLNPYAYAGGAPLTNVDPYGLDSTCFGGSECGDNPPVESGSAGTGSSSDSSGGTSGSSSDANRDGSLGHGGVSRGGSSGASSSGASQSGASEKRVIYPKTTQVSVAKIVVGSAAYSLVSDPVGAVTGYAKDLQDALIGPFGRLANAVVAPVVAGAITGHPAEIDRGEIASILIDTAVALITDGIGRAFTARAAKVAAQAAKVEAAEAIAQACVGPACPCFAAGTLVSTPRGFRTIDSIETGDMVMSRNEFTGEVSAKRVARRWITPDSAVIEISMRGGNDDSVERITTTPAHPFWVVEKGWTSALELRQGDRLISAGGGSPEVVGVRMLEEKQTVFNFEVEDFHTYFVGMTAAWVHNACSFPKYNRAPMNFSEAESAAFRAPAGSPCPACQANPVAHGGHATPGVLIQMLADVGLLTQQEAIAIARSGSNYISLCRSCNLSQGSKLIGNLPGHWVPPNPTPFLVNYLRSLGAYQ